MRTKPTEKSPLQVERGSSLKAFVSLMILSAFCLPFCATYLGLQLQKWRVKHEVKAKLIQGLDKSELTHLTFSKSQIETELDWEDDREFEYKGEMYDVIERHEKGDSVKFVCWHDKAETELNQRLQLLVAKAAHSSHEHQARESLYCKFLKSLVITVVPQLALSPIESQRNFASHASQYEFIWLDEELKPPRLS